MIFIFFITEAVVCILGGLFLIAIVLLGTLATDICTFCTENFWIFILITILLKIFATIYYSKTKNVKSAIAFLVATSQISVLFLDTLYSILGEGVDFFGSGWLMFVIVLPILLGYSYINLKLIFSAIKNDSVGGLWTIGIVGWLINIFVFS